jgi:hypothetical protein
MTRKKTSRRAKSAQRGRLPVGLLSRTALDELRRLISEHEIKPTATRTEPDWSALRASLAQGHKLEPADADELTRALERLWLLPFRRYEKCREHLVYYFARLPDAVKTREDDAGKVLADAFQVVVEMMLQGVNVFPVDLDLIAREIRRALETPGAAGGILPTARLLAGARGENGRCGENRWLCDDPNEIALHEHLVRRGISENAIGSLHKFDAYQKELAGNPLFRGEWNQLKAAFKGCRIWDKEGIVRRSQIPEENLHREPPPDFSRQRQAFQAAFDVFCWKWFLYGMKKASSQDGPLVQKLYHSFTPYGTAIFIPGFWSLDARRDLKWDVILRLHRARGVGRQGEKLSRNRQEKKRQVEKLRVAVREAKRVRLRGEKRMVFLKKSAGLSAETDDAYVRKLLRSEY